LCIGMTLLGAQIFLRPLLVSRIRRFYVFSFFLIGSALFYNTHLKFIERLNSPDPLSAHFLPPYQSLVYFFQQNWNMFWIPYAISFLVSLFFLVIVYAIPRNWRKLRLENHEPFLIALCIFLIGHPGWIFFFIVTPLLYLTYTIFLRLRTGKDLRVSFVNFWLPACLVTILILPWLLQLPIFNALLIFRNLG